MKLLLDVNVVLDLLLARDPWWRDSAQIWDGHRVGRLSASLSAFTLPTIFYIVRHAAVHLCLDTLEIASVQRSTLELAQTLSGTDFEDNLQIACAMESHSDVIITRDPAGFTSSPIPIQSPPELVKHLGLP